MKSSSGFFSQPRAVWATAFAAVVGFMSIGLVDPILVSIATGLNATPSQVSLLFSSYFGVTAAMMLVTGFVSSRIGGRRTLLLGAALVSLFAALSGTSDSVLELVLFRAGWGFGNALFVATALSVIVAVARGGTMTAILLYEAALGLGISVGPLLGAALGDVSWRYPFYGTAALMLIGFVCIAVFLERQPLPAQKVSFSDPIKALAHGGLATTSFSALFYNYAFFTVLAFVPFALRMSPHAVGLIFFGWGLMLAVFSVIVAPRLQARFSSLALLRATLGAFAVLLVAMAFGSNALIVVCVVLSGALMGINNTIYTEMALDVSDEPRPIASAAYNCVRWFAGVVAPYAAPKIAEHFDNTTAFLVAAAAAAIAPIVLQAGRRHLGRFALDRPEAGGAPKSGAAAVVSGAGGVTGLLVAIDGSAQDRALLDRAAGLSRVDGSPVHVLHVLVVEVFDDCAVDTETRSAAEAKVAQAVAHLHARGVVATGECIEEVFARAPQALTAIARRRNAGRVVIGYPHPGSLADAVHGSFSDFVALQPGVTLLRVAESECPVDG